MARLKYYTYRYMSLKKTRIIIIETVDLTQCAGIIVSFLIENIMFFYFCIKTTAASIMRIICILRVCGVELLLTSKRFFFITNALFRNRRTDTYTIITLVRLAPCPSSLLSTKR